MKKLLSIIVLMASVNAFANTPATTLEVDISGSQFPNHCTSELVQLTSGALRLVVREDFGGDVNGVHLLSKTAGSYRGIGATSGKEYIVNIAANAPSILPVSVSNFVNGAGTSNLLVHIEMIDLSDPGSGVSQVQAVIVGVIDGTGDFNQRVLNVSMDCKGQ